MRDDCRIRGSMWMGDSADGRQASRMSLVVPVGAYRLRPTMRSIPAKLVSRPGLIFTTTTLVKDHIRRGFANEWRR